MVPHELTLEQNVKRWGWEISKKEAEPGRELSTTVAAEARGGLRRCGVCHTALEWMLFKMPFDIKFINPPSF